MNDIGWVRLLIIGGGMAELIGIGLIVFEVRRNRRDADRYLRRGQTVYLGAALEGSSAGSVTLSTDREPTIEERLAQIETQIQQLRSAITDLPAELRKKWQEDQEALGKRLEQWVRDQAGAIEQLLLGVAAGAYRLRLIGVAFFVAGVVMNTIGNLWSIVLT